MKTSRGSWLLYIAFALFILWTWYEKTEWYRACQRHHSQAWCEAERVEQARP